MKLTTSTHDQFVVTAFHRYCLTRSTYAVSLCCDWIKAHWEQFDQQTKEGTIKETREALDRDDIRHVCDRRDWVELLNWMIEQERENNE